MEKVFIPNYSHTAFGTTMTSC